MIFIVELGAVNMVTSACIEVVRVGRDVQEWLLIVLKGAELSGRGIVGCRDGRIQNMRMSLPCSLELYFLFGSKWR